MRNQVDVVMVHTSHDGHDAHTEIKDRVRSSAAVTLALFFKVPNLPHITCHSSLNILGEHVVTSDSVYKSSVRCDAHDIKFIQNNR